MGTFHQITIEQRYQIYGMLQTGATQATIARKLEVSHTSIGRELRRNQGKKGWRPGQANSLAKARKQGNSNAQKLRAEHWEIIEKLLRQEYSPEQISGRLKVEERFSACPEIIYAHIYQDKSRGGDLYTYLRCQKQRKKRYGSGSEKRGALPGRVGIEERPTVVDSRSRLGDWEGDTVIGRKHKGSLVTLTERKSRYTLAEILPDRTALRVQESMTALLAHLPCHTITVDNGKEFAGHQTIAAKLQAQVYFAHPYSSWERGLNENTNGLLRQYFKKRSDFAAITPQDVKKALDRLNHRPRKVLGYRSPHEILFGKELCYV
jgi:IS30 family transposase